MTVLLSSGFLRLFLRMQNGSYRLRGDLKPSFLHSRHRQSNVRKSNSIELNRTQSNSIRGLSSIEFGSRTKSNTRLSMSSISEQIEFNRKNRTQSNSIHLIVFDWVRKPNSIEHNQMDCVRLGLVNLYKASLSKQVFLVRFYNLFL